DSIRFTLDRLARWFDWQNALIVVKPDTLIRWHRKGFRLFWKWKSRPRGRPQLPANARRLIREMALNNPTWGEERIADELLLKNRNPHFSTHDSALHAQNTQTSCRPQATLDDVRAQPR